MRAAADLGAVQRAARAGTPPPPGPQHRGPRARGTPRRRTNTSLTLLVPFATTPAGLAGCCDLAPCLDSISGGLRPH